MKSKAFWKAPFKNVKRLFPPDFMNNNNKKKNLLNSTVSLKLDQKWRIIYSHITADFQQLKANQKVYTLTN